MLCISNAVRWCSSANYCQGLSPIKGVLSFLWGGKINFFQMKVGFRVLSPITPNEKKIKISQKMAFWLHSAETPQGCCDSHSPPQLRRPGRVWLKQNVKVPGEGGQGNVPPGWQCSRASPAPAHPPGAARRCLTMSVSAWGDPTKTETTYKKRKNKSRLSPSR